MATIPCVPLTSGTAMLIILNVKVKKQALIISSLWIVPSKKQSLLYYSNVRSTSALALGKLSALSTRVDPLVGDLLTTLQVWLFSTSKSTLDCVLY